MENHELIWAMYFAQITGMALHPGNKKDIDTKATAALADLMLAEHQLRWPEETCHS